ncbi:MAG: phosphoglucosamine mutase, partial [Pseudomonadota bacterium]
DVPPPAAQEPGRLSTQTSADSRYVEALRVAVGPLDLRGVQLVVDAANGAAHRVAPALFESFGATVTAIACAPDGRNINAGCGATAPGPLGAAVRAAGAHLGVALDGDADRLILCDETGAVLDGDQIIGAIASAWAQDGRLRGDAVVATVMSNGGLVAFLEDQGVGLVRTPVGDRHVMARMVADDVNLGGEQSGHIIMSDFAGTGDGLLAALQMLKLLRADGRPLSEVGRVFTPWPQRLVNVAYPPGAEPLNHPQVAEAIAAAEAALAPRGRLLIRKSGTEPLIRVMTEGEDEAIVIGQADAVAHAVRAALPAAA